MESHSNNNRVMRSGAEYMIDYGLEASYRNGVAFDDEGNFLGLQPKEV